MKNIQSKHFYAFAAYLFSVVILFNLTSCGNTQVEANDQGQDTTSTDSANTLDKFKEGNFYYVNKQQFGDLFITRTKDSQIDSASLLQLVVKFDLKWENDTAYVLSFKEILANPQHIELPDLTGMNRHCYMTEPDDTSYLEISTSSLTIDTQIIKSRIAFRK